MRETCTYGSMRGSRRKTAKSVLSVVEDRAGVPDNKGRSRFRLPVAVFAHRHAEVLFEHGLCVVDAAEATLADRLE